MGGLLAAALPVVLLLTGAAPVWGHVQPPGVRTVVDRVDPPLPGVEVVLRTSVAPQLIVANRGGEPVEVLAETGEPFLRIGPAGVVANLASPAWYQSNNPMGRGSVPSQRPDRWVPVSRESSWGWFDHRMHPADLRIPPGTRPGTRLASWEVPLRQGGVMARIVGGVDFRAAVTGTAVSKVMTPAPAPGVQVSVLQGVVPGILLESSSGQPVIVGGREGEPFLRIGPQDVAANRRSPTHREVAQLTGLDVTEAPSPGAEPDWQQVAAGSRYAWLEPRAVLPESVQGAVTTWTIPLTVDGSPVALKGETRFTPAATPAPVQTSGPAWLLLAAGGVAAAAVAFVVVRRVRR
jgi:hypothetical protein